MELTNEEQDMAAGKYGKATQKAMEILVTLGDIYGAKRMIDITSVQIAGVSYANLNEPGLEWLADMAVDGKVRVFTTLNPAGMDLEEWKKLAISEDFAENQHRVVEAFGKMGVITTCSCTPYLYGNLPHYGQHIAWSESSAVCYANSVLGARTNREGGPSALSAALVGKTPEYGFHLDENRQPSVKVEVKTKVEGTFQFGALGKVLGDRLGKKISYITGIPKASVEELKSFCASYATYGGVALFHMEGITPDRVETIPSETIEVNEDDLKGAMADLDEDTEIDFISLGCPHASLAELEYIAKQLEGKKTNPQKEVWVTTARPTKQIADRMGFTKMIEDSGAKVAADTCCVVAPIKGRFHGLASDSAKMCYYGSGRNKFSVKLMSVDECIEEALK
ncbi:MAG: aconitase X catalytic domain-containing protein [Candidatus Heimdallarchaeota archaeon]|nr:MAG: aconitase X catalytic domain-containing protein [Candidatus Heimdallarchaeota archaeon]